MNYLAISLVALAIVFGDVRAHVQLIDRTQQPNAANEGIAKSLAEQIGPDLIGHGSLTQPNTSLFITTRDPFRAIRRGRQLFTTQVLTIRRARSAAK
jgi:hypothetical protein